MRRYWLPIAPLMFSHLGCAGSAGGFSGSNAMWHEPQDVPIEERRLDRAVGEPAHARVRRLRIGGHRLREALPAREAAVQLLPAGAVEARVGELAVAEGAGRGAESEIARRLPLVLALVVGIVRIDRGIAEIARRIAVALAADELEQLLVARAPVEAVGLVQALRRTAVGPRGAAAGVVDQAVGGEPVVAPVRAQDAEPVHHDAHALLEDISVEARVAAGRLVPDLPAGDLGRAQARLAGVETGVVGQRLGRRGGRSRWSPTVPPGPGQRRRSLAGRRRASAASATAPAAMMTTKAAGFILMAPSLPRGIMPTASRPTPLTIN